MDVVEVGVVVFEFGVWYCVVFDFVVLIVCGLCQQEVCLLFGIVLEDVCCCFLDDWF